MRVLKKVRCWCTLRGQPYDIEPAVVTSDACIGTAEYETPFDHARRRIRAPDRQIIKRLSEIDDLW